MHLVFMNSAGLKSLFITRSGYSTGIASFITYNSAYVSLGHTLVVLSPHLTTSGPICSDLWLRFLHWKRLKRPRNAFELVSAESKIHVITGKPCIIFLFVFN